MERRRTKVGGEVRLAEYRSASFAFELSDGIALITLSRPERKNALTFEVYSELRDLFRLLPFAEDVKAVIITGAGTDFSSGGDVYEIVGPLTEMDVPSLLSFTQLTVDVVKAMLLAPQPIIAAIDGVCTGAGAALAMASDFRLATPRARVAFLFNKVGLAGCDMGSCAMLPRIIGFGRAAELLLTGRFMSAEEGMNWGFYNRLCPPESLLDEAKQLAQSLAQGPTFAQFLTKRMLYMEWSMPLSEALDAEAQVQALCMLTKDFHRAYEAFLAKQKPVFGGE
jgi:enoyl-CoA hydratase/carnithine racemase